MSKRYRKKRKPGLVFKTNIRASVIKMASEFLGTKEFDHAGTKGSERELPVISFFKDHLPDTYDVVTGEIVDLFGNHSPQMDVMIYDKQRNFAFSGKKKFILPAEALLVSIEVKSKLTKQELKKALSAAKKLKSLKPFRMLLSLHRKRGQVSRAPRYFHCIFAYDSDLTYGKDWINREYNRLVDVSNELSISSYYINRLYVANRGLIYPDKGSGIVEEKGSGEALMYFYMHILNFLSRENGRRKPTPYSEYAGDTADVWIKLKK